MSIVNNARRAFLLLLLLGGAPIVRGQRVVRITNGEWPPYLSKDLPGYGIASRIVTEAFALQGISVRYGFFPWRRGFALAASGEWEGTTLWLESERRDKLFYVSDEVVHAEIVFFHRKDVSFDWTTLQDLAKYRIGISNDYFYGEKFHAALQSGLLTQVESVPSDEQNFRKLLFKRIDIFPIDKIAGNALLKQRFSDEDANLLASHPKPLYSGAMHLFLNRKDPNNRQLMQDFNLGLQKLKASGKFRAYLREAEQERTVTDTK